MSIITTATARLIDIAVEQDRTDAVQSFVNQETILVDVETWDGGTGTGYSCTIGTGGTSVLALVRDHLLPALVGQDARNIGALWQRLFALTRATTTGAITSLALAAVDTALWDLRSKRTGEPLWRLAGAHRQEAPVYDTEGGRLHLSTEELVEGALRAQESGWAGVKIKVGRPHPSEDAERLRAVREAVGPALHIMTDANQSQTGSSVLRLAAALEPYDPYWLEEPLPADDISGHTRLAAATRIPVAVGESMYSRAPGAISWSMTIALMLSYTLSDSACRTGGTLSSSPSSGTPAAEELCGGIPTPPQGLRCPPSLASAGWAERDTQGPVTPPPPAPPPPRSYRSGRGCCAG
ncbi:mandelate racemase/muconate lactonizing enzyme family protein [Streptomyces hokutonensis]|uniref:mandelate racemase/muconate lactonizing enzyme family protein n=1 Tax=Streptomyces hokutonensis TaxID=1306990 RepID=UPI00367B95C2